MKQYYFSIEQHEDEYCDDTEDYIPKDGLLVCISPKDYTDDNECCIDEHLTDELDPIIGNLPFILSEDSEANFTVWDLKTPAGLIPADQINYVRKEILKLPGFIERQSDEWLN